jgi:hypothetical protein
MIALLVLVVLALAAAGGGLASPPVNPNGIDTELTIEHSIGACSSLCSFPLSNARAHNQGLRTNGLPVES